jgi:hypothetical protein
VLDAISRGPTVAPPVPGYDPIPRLVGTKYEPLLNQSLGDTSPDETTARMAKFDAEQKDQQTLADAGWGGTVAALAAGALDPSWFIPIAGEARAGAELGIGARILRGAGEGALRSGVSETALMASQVTRTPETAAADVATNTILMGLIGGGTRYLEGGERKGAVDGLEAMRRDLSPGAAPAMAEDVSAAAADKRTMVLSPILPPIVRDAIAHDPRRRRRAQRHAADWPRGVAVRPNLPQRLAARRAGDGRPRRDVAEIHAGGGRADRLDARDSPDQPHLANAANAVRAGQPRRS